MRFVGAVLLAIGLASNPTAVAADESLPGTLQPGDTLIVRDAGTRLRARPDARSDVRVTLEAGRWMEFVEEGPSARFGDIEAPWVHVRDPWAPSEGIFAGVSEGWVWGGLLRTLPDDLPAPTRALWDRVLVRQPAPGDPDSEGRPALWALRAAGELAGQIEIGEWLGPSEAPDTTRLVTDWSSIESVHPKDPGNGRDWLWLAGRSMAGERTGALIPTRSQEDPLLLALDQALPGGEALRGDFLLLDLDGDGVDEALVQWTRTNSDRDVVTRHFAPFELREDGTHGPTEPEEIRDALIPPPDLRVESVSLSARGRRQFVVVRIRNDGSRSKATHLRVRLTSHRGQAAGSPPALVEVEVAAMSPNELRALELVVEVGSSSVRRTLVDATVVPTGVEADLSNNRLAVWQTP